MPTALLAGAFGRGDLGAEALLQAFATALPDWNLAATASNPTSPLSITDLDVEVVPARRPLALAARTLRADAVIVGGGTVFANGRRPCGLLANAAVLVGTASMLGRPVAMIGVGAGHIAGSLASSYARFVVRHSDLLILGDEASAGRLSGAGAPGPFRVGADPTWTLLEPPQGLPSRSERILIVPSREAAMAIGGIGPFTDRLVAVIERVAAPRVEVWLQAWQQGQPAGVGDDVAIVSALARRLGDKVGVLPNPRTLPEAVQTLKSFGAVLSFCFHALIAAGAAGTRVVAVAHEPKMSWLASRLGQ
ncbi:MAG: polysaccharide pyruvyl transferase family protein, partial [Acidimicrobiales bacterium]